MMAKEKPMPVRFVMLFGLLSPLVLPLAAGEPPPPPPGMGEYVMVLKAPAAVPPGQVKPNPGKKIVEQVLTKLGGRLLHSQENERRSFCHPVRPRTCATMKMLPTCSGSG
jgi:hypothetical protein